MATGTEAKIVDTLLARVGTLVTSPATTVAYPNRAFSAARPYLQVAHLPNVTDGPLLDESRDYRGILQVTVVSDLNRGIVDPSELASQIVAHFPETLRLGSDPIVTFPDPASVSPPVTDDNEVRVPVTIPYLATK